MKKKWALIVTAAMALLMIASQATAFRGYGSPGNTRGCCPQMSGYWASELDLTEPQKDQIRAMNETFTNENNELKEQIYAKHQELRQLWAEPEPDQNRIIAKQQEINQLKNDLRDKTTLHRMKVRNEVLTYEQREKLSGMMQDRDLMRGYRDGNAPRGKPGRGGGRPGGMGW